MKVYCFVLKYLGRALNDDKVRITSVEKLMRVKQMRVYDELREMDIEDNERSIR